MEMRAGNAGQEDGRRKNAHGGEVIPYARVQRSTINSPARPVPGRGAFLSFPCAASDARNDASPE